MNAVSLLFLPWLTLTIAALGAGAPQGDRSFGYDSLKALIQAEKLDNPDQLLRFFSRNEVSAGFLRRFVLLYRSASLQRADVSPEFPRVLTYGGRLVLALTGRSPALGGKSYNRIEIIEYVPEEARFAFHLVDFDRHGPERFVDRPATCTACHGTPARPIWSTYPQWPGMYGADDDTLYEERAPVEAAHWKSFYHTNAGQGRYALFKLEKEFNLDSASPRYALDGITPFVPPMPLPTRAGLGLSEFFARPNLKRIDQEIVNSRSWTKYKFALAGAILDCEDIESFLPDPLRREGEKRLGKTFAALHADTLARIRAGIARKESLFDRLSGSKGPGRPSLDAMMDSEQQKSILFYPQHLGVLSKLRYLIEGMDCPDIRVDHWGLDFDPDEGSGSYTLDRTYGNLEWLSEFLEEHAKTDEELHPFLSRLPGLKSEQRDLCSALSAQSRRTLGEVSKP